MKFYQQINKYMEEADIERLAKQDSREEYEDELDKKEAYKRYLYNKDEPGENASVYSMLENLYTKLSPDAKTRQGGLVSEALKDIINEFREIVSNARRTSDSPDAIQYLLHKLSND